MTSRLKGKRVLVTGGTGFIGSALVKGLVGAGARVRSFDDDSRGIAGRLGALRSEVELVAGDIRDGRAVRAATQGMDSVCHLAYINGTEHFYSRPELILEVATKGMMNVLDACLAENVRDLLLMSSSEVYQRPPVIPTDESTPLVVPDLMNPRFSYGGGKIISELLAVNYGRKYFDHMLICRPHNVYGPDMGREHVVPQFILRLRDTAGLHPHNPVDFPIQGTGEETRSFIYIDDFVRALLLVMEQGERLGIYHIGTEREVSIGELAHLAAAACGRTIRVVPGELLAGSSPRRCPDTRKLRALGFEPAVPLEQGLKLTADWYLSACATA